MRLRCLDTRLDLILKAVRNDKLWWASVMQPLEFGKVRFRAPGVRVALVDEGCWCCPQRPRPAFTTQHRRQESTKVTAVQIKVRRLLRETSAM